MGSNGELLVCAWCESGFARRCWRGRRPNYCRRSCRQRAYEARRLAAHAEALHRPPRLRPTRSPGVYESGRSYDVRHALRPDGAADEYGWRPTLCGTRAHVQRAAFEPWRGRPRADQTCQTCWAVAERFPAAGPLDISNDLARARRAIRKLRSLVASAPSVATLRDAIAEALACVEGEWTPPAGRRPDSGYFA